MPETRQQGEELRLRVALVAREVYPLAPGGIGNYVASTARLLSRIAEVTIVTTSVFAPAYEQLVREADPRLPPDGIRVAFVEEPTQAEADEWYDRVQCYGARVLERLRELYPGGGPDVIEFPDYLGEGFVTIQAAQALDPFLRETCVCVRLHTSIELCRILNARYPRDMCSQTQFEMERYSLANADRVLWQGGDVLGTYRRFYGANALGPAMRIRSPYSGPAIAPDADCEFVASSPLRLLYIGRLERRKGTQNLVRAASTLSRDDFRLTLVGADTDTGPLDVSMREMLRLELADDERIELREGTGSVGVEQQIRAHDVVVLPSLWECWPYVALEALHLNRPVLATPVGGLVELVAPGESGWLAGGTGRDALAAALESTLERRQEAQELTRGGAPSARARLLSDDSEILDCYRQLAQVKRRGGGGPARADAAGAGARADARGAGARASRVPLVSAIVPYYRSSEYVREAIESLLAQTYPRLEIVLVNDGSFEDDDWVLGELSARAPVVVVSQMNSGLGAARNLGVSQVRGRYVFPLDADNIASPDFVARCVEVLEHRPEVAYVTSWSRYIESDGSLRPGPQLGYQPLGNHTPLVASQNVAGDAAALIRKRIFDLGFRYSEELTSFEDWHFYRELRRAGHFGAVIPERLILYRVREDSMQAEIAQPRRARLEGEINALLRENEARWKSLSA